MQTASVIKFSLFTISTYFLTINTLLFNTVPTLHLSMAHIGIYTEHSTIWFTKHSPVNILLYTYISHSKTVTYSHMLTVYNFNTSLHHANIVYYSLHILPI